MLCNKKTTFIILECKFLNLEYKFLMLCNKKTRNVFRADFLVLCSGFSNSLLKYEFFKVGDRQFHFSKYKKFSQSGFLSFFELRKLLPKRQEISWNTNKFWFLKYKEFFRCFRFRKYKKNFLLRIYKKSLNIRARKFHFPKYKDFFNLGARKFHSLKYKKFFQGGFFFFFFLSLDLKVC